MSIDTNRRSDAIVEREVNQRGIAMIAALLVMLLVSALLVGFTAAVVSDQRFRGIDHDHEQAFYAAQAGLEKLTTDLGNLFQTNFAPKATNINTIKATPPTLTGIAFTAAGGAAGSGYNIQFTPDANGNPAAVVQNISSGPYEGLIALLTPYTIDVTAKTLTGGEVHLQRQLETSAIPVFQFGIFSNTDLSFFAGPNFGFGGRVHTNGNLWLAEGDNDTLTLSDKVTAVGEIIRTNLSNGATLAQSTHSGTVSQAKAPGAFRNLAATEGSLVGMLGTAQNPNWTNISLTTYNGYIRNGRTGVDALNLPVITGGRSKHRYRETSGDGDGERRQPRGVRRTLLQQGEPADSAVRHGSRHHEPADGQRDRAGAARWRLESHSACRLRSRGCHASADCAIAGAAAGRGDHDGGDGRRRHHLQRERHAGVARQTAADAQERGGDDDRRTVHVHYVD